MFIPIHDKNKLKCIPFQRVTVALIALNFAVFTVQFMLSEEQNMGVAFVGGLIPSAFFGIATLPAGYDFMPLGITLITYMFLHGSWLHLIGNMVFLWVFGDNVEDAMGHGRFLVFYLLCGIAAGLGHAAMDPASEIPLVGASGATAGVIGAYVLLYPRVKVWILVLLRIPLRVPAYLAVVAWLAFQIFFIVTNADDMTAWWAHLAGFAAGCALIPFMRRPGFALFADTRPEEPKVT